MKFSICIPNYNYGQYIGETIQSVLNQDYDDFEVLIADNKSTDNSWEVIQSYAARDTRILAWQNPTNLGFAGNLDAVCSKARGEYQILVSSDDLMNPGALKQYAEFLRVTGQENVIFGSACIRIDSESKPIGYDPPSSKLWRSSDLDQKLSVQFNCNVYKVATDELLKRCLLSFYGPFNFVATCYPSRGYQKVGGYGGGRMYNPDKWFHWRLLASADYAYYIDAQFFSYRWHQNNQAALEKESGALKYFMDEYRSSFEADAVMLGKSGLSRQELQRSFIHNAILKYVFAYIKTGKITMARRVYQFGWATYPSLMKKNKISWLLVPLLVLGKLGTWMTKSFKKNYVGLKD